MRSNWSQGQTGGADVHLHPPSDAGEAEPPIEATHHLGVLFTVLDWVADRVETLHEA